MHATPFDQFARDAAELEAHSPRGNETILLVDDQPSVRSVTREILSRLGYTVLEAENGRRALDVAARHPGRIHLVLTDEVMPEMIGSELARRLTVQRPALKVLFMSGYSREEMVRAELNRVTHPLVEKPFSATGLAVAVRRVLG